MWLMPLLAGALLSSCVSNNLRQARQMMAEQRFDQACYWYDEAIAELVPNNRLILERRSAYRAACEFHAATARQKLSAGELPGAVAEARAAERCAAEVPGFTGQVPKIFDACAGAYAKRAASYSLETEDSFKQAISDLDEAAELVPDSGKRQRYAESLNSVRARFADWLKKRGRLAEATRHLAGVRAKPSTGPETTPSDDSAQALKRMEEEIKQRQRAARDHLARAEKLLQEGKWEEAISGFRGVGEMDRTLEWRGKYGERRALAGQAREKIQAAIKERNWDGAKRWLKQWQENRGGDEAADAVRFVEGGRRSDELLAQADEQARLALLSSAEDLLKQARNFEAVAVKRTDAIGAAIDGGKGEALKAANSAKELAMQARFAGARSQIERGEDIWRDWDGWAGVMEFVSDEEVRAEIITAAQEALKREDYRKAREKYLKALEVRYDLETASKARTCEAWLSSNELLAKAELELEKKNLRPAVVLAARAVKLNPGNGQARTLLDKAKKLRAGVDSIFTEAKEFCQRKDWWGAIRLLEQCVFADSTHGEASEMLRQAKENLRDEWGVRYDPDARPAHVILRHWLTWLAVLAMMAVMIALRKSAYVRFAVPAGRQLALRGHLLGQKWWRNARIAGLALFLAILLVIVISWVFCERRVARLTDMAGDFESSGRLLEAREVHQSILEFQPFSHYAPSSRLAIFTLSKKLPENERIPVQNHQTGLQNWFEGSRRAVSPYSIDYAPMLVSLISLTIFAFLLAFRLKKRLVPRFLLCVFSIPAVMVLIIELLSTQSVGTGAIALPLSAFSRYIPHIAANASLAGAVVLCFVGSESLAASMLFLAKRRADKSAARRERRKPFVVGKTKEAFLKEELPWFPAPKSRPESPPETEDEVPAAAGAPLRDPNLRELPAIKEEEPAHAADADVAGQKEHPQEPPVPPKAPPEKGPVMAADDYGKLLSDTEPQLRIEAARALGALGDARALEPLVEALSDPDERVRETAAEALEKMGRSDLDLLKIAHKKEKDEEKKEKLGEIIASIAKRAD